MDWLPVVWPTIAAFLVGGGGVAWYNAVKQGKQGDRAAEVAASDSGTSAWEKMLKTQVEVIVNPLKESVVSLTARVALLEAEREEWTRKERLYWKWTDDLVDHINAGNPPPPPSRPPGL